MRSTVSKITTVGTGNANALAGGISEALLTTAAGLIVAIPALVMHRYYTGLIDTIVVDLEREAIKQWGRSGLHRVKFKRQRRDTLAVNLTPLIDVVLLLLIFFMVSTSFTDLSELVVNLKGLNGTPFPADAENLRAIIIEKTGSRRDIPVSIVADGDTRHAMVVMSMDTVSQLGFKRLSISTQRPAAGE